MVSTDRAAGAPSRFPIHVVGAWALTLAGLVLSFTPFHDAAYPAALVGWLGFFLPFAVGAPKMAVTRLPVVSLGAIGAGAVVMALSIHVASWGNVWLALAPVAVGWAITGRYVLFRKLGYTRWPYLDVGFVLVSLLICLAGNLAPPDGLTGWLALLPLVIFGLAGLEPTLVRVRRMLRTARDIVAVGEEAPDFELRSHRDELVRLSDFRGKRAVLLFFVLGDWCPGCHIMLRAYERARSKFKEKNVAVLAIGPDPIGVNREMVDSLRLEYGLLGDPDGAVARTYRVLVVESKDPRPLILPTSFLIDENGIIRFSSGTAAGQILEPEAILPTLEALPAR